MNRKKLLTIGILCALLLPLTASAHVSFKRTEKEDKFQFKIDAGETITHEIYLLNIQDEPIDVEVYSTDGTITSNGAFSVLSRNENQTALGTWINFTDDTTLHLEGKEERLIPFTISVPEGTTPGVYGGGLSASPIVATQEMTSGAGAIVSTRVVQPIYVEVPGTKVSKYDWGTFTYTGGRENNFNFSFKNEGNTIIKVNGDIEIRDTMGNVSTIPMSEITLLQGGEAKSKAEWKTTSFIGFYNATANLTFSELDVSQNDFITIKTETRELSFSIIPWTYVFLLLALILGLIAFYISKKGAQKRFLKKCVKYTVAEGETIKSVATSHNIDWEKLAKINNIKAPYELTKGQVILVPPKK